MITDNELIARFMGGVSQKATSYCISDYPNELPLHILKDLKYHKSWDWLIPVVEKIEDVKTNGKRVIRAGANVTIYYKACIIKFEPDEDGGDENEEFACQTKGETKLDAVYKAVIKFIKHCNCQ